MIDPAHRVKILEVKVQRLTDENDTLREQVRQLKEQLMPVYVWPLEWGLTPSEELILRLAVEKPPHYAVRNEFAMSELENLGGRSLSSNIVAVNISRLRKRFSELNIPLEIFTQHSVGYGLTEVSKQYARQFKVEVVDGG